MILRKIPIKDRPALRVKVAAGDAFKGRRVDWGVKRKWIGNYLNSVRKICIYNICSST